MKSSTLRFGEFILVSLLLHAAFFISMFIKKTVKPPVPVEVTVEIVQPPPPPPLPVPPRPQIEDNTKIVETLNKEKVDLPVKSRLLSNQNQIVKKQTLAKNAGKITEKSKDSKEEKNPEKGGLKKNRKAASQETIKDVDEGLETLLQTKEFQFFNYFKRIREHMGDYWASQVQEGLESLIGKGERVNAGDELVSKLFIRIDRSGNIVDVILLRSCGYDDLDNSVVAAFKKASPFAAPPPSVLESDGTVKVTWDFVLE